ncbi:MAG TPA: c-type cytochrome [Mucilaginibacter sp.]|jgi:hypothetical protein|nr:c-type cytochrome [Mucilaginibacter sp.]
MITKHKLLFGIILAVPVTIAAATGSRPQDDEKFTNLKVLPTDISPQALKKIMISDFEDGLGVGCNFCHAPGKTEGELDYASDAKPEKEIARLMMRVTLGINKKYFKVKHPMIGSDALTVNCNTCHNGVAFPEGK